MEQNGPGEVTTGPDAARVLERLVQVVKDEQLQVDRLEVRQATPVEYTYRIYPSPDEDYEGGVLTFES